MLSQLLPGDTPESSVTNQYYLMEDKPTKEQAELDELERLTRPDKSSSEKEINS